MAARPRFEVRELGPRDFVVHDNVSQLDYDLRFTRKAAQKDADQRNVAAPPLVEPGPAPGWWDETPAEAARADDQWWTDRFDTDRDED